MEYLTFELEIGKSKDHEYEVRVLHSPAGEPRATMTSLFKKTELEQGLLALRAALLRSEDKSGKAATGASEQTSVRELGQELFKSVIAGDIHVCYERSLDIAEKERKGLRVQLRIVAPEMATLPWEYMYDPDHSVYLGRYSQTPIVRYLELGQAVETLMIKPPLRILGMVANPEGTEQLKFQPERRNLEDAIGLLQGRGQLEITWVSGETWEDLKCMMQKGPWHIFHFIGHGGFDATQGEGYIFLSDEQDKAHRLLATGLADLLTAERQQRPRLVVLNACKGAQSSEQDIFSSTASILVRRGIPAVAAMQYAITDQAAIEFSKSFYRELVKGKPIEVAIADARYAIYMTSKEDSVEWGTPVLYSHARDGILFRLEEDSRQFSLSLNPSKKQGWGKGVFTVEVHNQGNTDVTVQLEVDDLENVCSYAFDSSQVTVPAGQVRSTQLIVSTSKHPLWKSRVYLFTVTVWPVDAPQLVQKIEGKWQQSPPIGLRLGFLTLFTAILSYVMYSMAYYLFCLDYLGSCNWYVPGQEPPSTTACLNVTEIPMTECKALAALYNNIGGTNWITKTAWLETNTPCSWYGVTCERGKVTELRLVENNLVGEIPATIGELSALTRLDFFKNPKLGGTIPATIGNLTELQSLRIQETNVSGEIPEWLGQMKELRMLALGFNKLSGEIPPALGRLSELKELYLGGSGCTGTIPPEFGSLTNLEYLHLSRCQLSGRIPPELGNLRNLTYLDLYGNQLDGGIPKELYRLPNLTYFAVDQKQLGIGSPNEAVYVYVSAGPFTMGSNEQQIEIAEGLCRQYSIEPQKCPGQFRNEAGQNTVNVDGFWIMQTEVTNQQYSAFMNDGGYTQRQYWSDDGWIWRTGQNVSEPRYWGDTNFRGGNKPVVGVSWYEAEAYTRWLSAKTGRKFRLPTEAEWEKAARGTDGHIFPWGDNWDESRGQRLNYCDATCCNNDPKRCQVQDNISDYYTRTAPVGNYPLGASPYGALDMAGNVSEWVADWYGEDAYTALSAENPLGPNNGELRVVRGGSWLNVADYLRATMRGRDFADNHRADRPDGRLDSVGFRVVAVVE